MDRMKRVAAIIIYAVVVGLILAAGVRGVVWLWP